MIDATAPHTRIDNFVIDEYGDKIGVNGLAIYMVIKRHYNWLTGQCTPSYNRIAAMCKISRSTVIRYVKRLKAFGLIDPQMRFTDEGQTSNQYGFYQPERPKPAQESTTTHMNTPTQASTPVSEGHPPGVRATPKQVFSEQEKEEKENAKTMPLKEGKEEKTQNTEISVPSNQGTGKPGASGKAAPTEKQRTCPHPYYEVVTLSDGVTICNHCFSLIDFLPDAEAA